MAWRPSEEALEREGVEESDSAERAGEVRAGEDLLGSAVGR